MLFLPASERFISTPVSTSYSCFFLFVFFFLGSKAILGTFYHFWNILVLCDSTSCLFIIFWSFVFWNFFSGLSNIAGKNDQLIYFMISACYSVLYSPKIMCSTSKLSDNLVFLSVSLRFKCIACLNVMSVSSRSLILPVLKK